MEFISVLFKKKNKKSNTRGLKLGRKPVLSLIIEDYMSEYINDLSKLFYGITLLLIRNITYDLVEKN